MAKLTIIGIGGRPLDVRARQAAMSAQVIVGPRRLCDVFAGYAEWPEARGKIRQIGTPDETIDFIRESFGQGKERIVLLASGDPLFFGIGRRVVMEFGRDVVEIIPDVSSVQLAFSRIKEPWDDALLISLHGNSDAGRRRKLRYTLADLPGLLAVHHTIAVLTDGAHSPAAIAAAVTCACASRPSLLLSVCERLGYDDERITEGSPDEIAAMSFGDPNVVIIRDAAGPPPVRASTHPRLGLREEEMAHSGGLITKDEVRAVTLHALRLPEKGVLWDIGAGSGAVSLEAARLCPGLQVFAVERDEGQHGLISQNRARFGLLTLTIVGGEAPQALSSLPAPDRVFIGGSGGKLCEIIDAVQRRMEGGGIVVINAATLETLHDAWRELEKAGYALRISEVSVARAKPVGDKRHMAALNPVFVITGEKR
jgi:precorrin-6Y C5,15-methyltransferase (decarboxylating)